MLLGTFNSLLLYNSSLDIH